MPTVSTTYGSCLLNLEVKQGLGGSGVVCELRKGGVRKRGQARARRSPSPLDVFQVLGELDGHRPATSMSKAGGIGAHWSCCLPCCAVFGGCGVDIAHGAWRVHVRCMARA